MKKVLSNDMVAHVWAQLSQPCGYNSSRSMSFDGAREYSYAEHEATLVRTGAIPHSIVALFNSNARGSVTTKWHVSRYYGAARQYPRFTVPSIGGHSSGDDIDHARNIAHLVAMYETARAQLMKCPAESWRLADDKSSSVGTVAHNTLRDAAKVVTDYCRLFDQLPHAIVNEWQKHADAAIARRDRLLSDPKRQAKMAAAKAAREAREARQRELDRADLETRIAAWRGGKSLSYVYRLHSSGDALLRIKGDTVQTSHGVDVPLLDAQRALSFYRTRMVTPTTFEPWQSNGHTVHIGQFKLDSIDADGNVRAGCHTITREELEHFGKLLEQHT
jgi:hypothetical protein